MSASDAKGSDPRRRLPAVDQVLQLEGVPQLIEAYGRTLVVQQVRWLLDQSRHAAGSGDAPHDLLNAPVAVLTQRLAETTRPSLVPLINATGVVLHTNLGRAPLPAEAAARVAALASTYSNLEYDLEAGERGNREVHAETRLREILGAEATAVVNNNAAAVLLALNTLSDGREVLVSRGELVEIGGSFRIPEILAKSGARLREVGTTNRTRISDYREALGPQSGAILRVHQSNFQMVGFTEAPQLLELAELAREAGLPLVEDLGSGLLTPQPGALSSEPTVSEALKVGVEVVTWSGDKLLGGPQAGLVAGRTTAVRAMRANPLYRALRVDKMTLAALDAVLVEYQCGRASRTIPAQHMIGLPASAIRARAQALVGLLAGECPDLRAEVTEGVSAVGGGSAPAVELSTALVSLAHPALSATQLAAALRAGTPPVVSRTADDRVLIDLRTVPPEQDETLAGLIAAACRR